MSTLDWIVSHYRLNSLLALFTYWIPLVICLIVYLFRFIEAYRRDVRQSSADFYTPSLTIGVILGHLFMAFMPVVNLMVTLFDCLGSVFKWFGRVLDIPLVKKRASIKNETSA